jgi:predicted nucleotidyltransferase
MRNTRPIDVLFPKTRRELLAATFGQPERWWYLSELAEHLNTTPSSLQRELKSLVTSGILRHRRDGKRTYFQVEKELPIFDELRAIFMKTLGITDALKNVLAKFGDRIRCAFIYGSVARHEERALSDVDMIVIGSVGLSDLSPLLRVLEKKFKREFNAKCYSPEEFRQKVEDHNHFVLNVLKKEKVFLWGDKDELESIAGEQGRAAA